MSSDDPQTTHEAPSNDEPAVHPILLVDDHTFFRAGTRRILEDQPDFRVVGEAGSGAEALDLLERCDPEVMVLDVNLPEMGGIAVCEAVRKARPALSIVILTGHNGEALMRALNKLGVRGYFLKSTNPEEFIAGLRKVCQGERAFCKEAQGVIDTAKTDDDLLSPREL